MRVDSPDTNSHLTSVADQPGDPQTYHGLRGISRQLANLVNSPIAIIFVTIVPLSIVAWIWLFFAAQSIASSNAGATLGPSMQLLEPYLRGMEIAPNNGLVAYIIAICTPSSFAVSITAQSLVVMFVMWLLMAIAMMLPSAAPMLRTYADIADTAADRGEPAVPVAVLALGYLTIWGGFAVQATLIQAAIIAAGQAGDASAPLTGILGGGILVFAGLYQFTPLKNACLVKCRNPFAIIFGQWSTKHKQIYRLGLQQGLFCLGCCWAIMLVMLTVGTMNLMWMVFLTLFTLLEKTSSGYAVTRVFGVVLLAWGLFLVLTSANLIFSLN